jgi:flagellar hook protein FlgE
LINAAAPPGVTASIVGGKLVLTGDTADRQIIVNHNGSATALFTELGVGIGTTNPTNLLTQAAVAQGQTMDITVGGNTVNIVFGTGPGEVSTIGELATALSGVTGGTASIAAGGNISIIANGNNTIAVSGTANPLRFGMHTTSAIATDQVVVGNDLPIFIDSPVDIQLRWAKTDSTTLGTGHTDTWNLFYQINSNATGTTPAWRNVGTNFTFDANGQMNPVVSNLTLPNVVVDGVSLGSLNMAFGVGGITQFSDPNGGAEVNQLEQNGFSAGSLQSVTVNEKGRLVGSYSNGRSLDLAEITLATFSGANYLKRLDGGAFEATDESGNALYNSTGKILASSLEGSNTDIADEFTKLIVTQQAYSANTRVISTTNDMVQDLLNMLR